jgi:hypothetical protein
MNGKMGVYFLKIDDRCIVVLNYSLNVGELCMETA